MRFYLPDWDDNVDAEYDFLHDENSHLRKSDRPLNFIWDIYGRDQAPIDGVLVSREQIEDSEARSRRIRNNGLSGGMAGGIPEWLPTIVDCGAWGYRKLPEPPYKPDEIMDFYADVDMTVGVTIDHLIFDSEPVPRLYLNERALPDDADVSALPGTLGDGSHQADVMIAPWRTESTPDQFNLARFDSADEFLSVVVDDDRAKYVENDSEHRFDLTLKNAERMRALYKDFREHPFRLMAAVQGWSPETYAEATEQVLEMGYDYIGLGGLAASSVADVKETVQAVGEVVDGYESEYQRRIDVHIFGFAKNDAFDQIRHSGVSSFDSASMLRASWIGGNNYHLGHDRKHDAIRVHPSTPQHDFRESIDLELRGQPILQALRAYDRGDSLIEAMGRWRDEARSGLKALPRYLERNRHEGRFEASSLTDVRQAFRDDFEYGRLLGSSFGNLRSEIGRLLKNDSGESPIPFEEYHNLIDIAEDVWEERFPRPIPIAQQGAEIYGEDNLFDQLMLVLRDYVEDFGEEDYLGAYSQTLRDRPWNECSCPICERMGIDVAIFRRNNRNRRRGFHNIHRFYEEFASEFPKVMVATTAKSSVGDHDTIGDYLRDAEDAFWNDVYDIPVIEIGVIGTEGVTEWWDTPSNSITGWSEAEDMKQYDHLLIYGQMDENVRQSIKQANCEVRTYEAPPDLRRDALELVSAEMKPGRMGNSTTGEN